MHSRTLLVASALIAVLLASCASNGVAPREAKSAPEPAAASNDPVAPAVTLDPTPDTPTARSNVSALVQPGQDPTVAGKGINIRDSPPGFDPLPAALKLRADQRWKHLIAGEGEKAYDFLTVGVRSTLKRDVYAEDMRSRPVKWLTAEALDGQCEPTRCSVRIVMSFKFEVQSTGSGPIESLTSLTEHWILVGGEWFFIPTQFLEGITK